MSDQRQYARRDLLTETDWLAAHGQDASVRVIDCGTAEAYRRAHIPGALSLGGVAPQIKDPSNPLYVMPAAEFAALMGRLGVDDATSVVTYDDNNSLWAARLWWVLQYHGHSNAKVLNGGWQKWLHEGRPISTQATQPEPLRFTPRTNDALLCTAGRLSESAQAMTAQILDVRSAEEYAGTNSRGNQRVGHVPGARHIEWLQFMSSDAQQVFRPAADIQQLLDGAGIRPDREVITYCQAGIRAAHVMFVLSLMGYDRVRNYDGSMQEWANRADTDLVLTA